MPDFAGDVAACSSAMWRHRFLCDACGDGACVWQRAGMSSDESFRMIKKVQDLTKDVITKLTEAADKRKTEINAA